MVLDTVYLNNLEYLSPENIAEILSSKDRPKFEISWMIENQISPADLFCYLHARFGPPNGVQNFFRGNTSDNLIHWNWTFRSGDGLIDILGMNFCTNIMFTGNFDIEDGDINEFITLVKSDFKNHGEGMSKCRNSLEDWIEFINPYQRLRQSIDQLVKELSVLNISDINELPAILSSSDQHKRQEIISQWNDAGMRLSKAFGICFGIRSMLPVMAEAFINLILFTLMHHEIKKDDRLKNNLFKQDIDVRVKSLHLNCDGFEKAVDFSNSVCRQYNRLVNERNDLLHGNIAINKLKFNEVYFIHRVPIFKKYRSMWNRVYEVQKKSVGLDKVMGEIAVVTDFIDYVLSCLDDRTKPAVEQIMSSRELGLLQKELRVGVLFPNHIVDFRGISSLNVYSNS